MQSLIFALNATLPIVILAVIGYFLRRVGLVDLSFSKKLNKLVFRVFLPVMLFLNVYSIDASMNIGVGYIIYSVIAILAVFFVSLILIPIFVKKNDVRAVLLQASFRSNFALVGLPLAELLFGSEGAAVAALLSAISIPLFNILAVLCFSIFGEGEKPNFKKIILGIIKNPLIIAVFVVAVFLFVKNLLIGVGVNFRLESVTVIYKPLTYLSSVATPLAIITLGAQFEFSDMREYKKPLIIMTVLRTPVLPSLLLGVAYLLGIFGGAHFAAFIALFATPIAVSSVPMAQELGGNSRLAGQLVISTTVLSGLTIFLFTFILKLVGVF